MEGNSMERTVGTSLLLQMMRNRVYEVEDEYYLYLNEIEDKLLEHETISISKWKAIFKYSSLSQDEYENFKKLWVEAYVRYYFFKEALKDLPNTTDINTVRRIITVDDLAYPSILNLKLAYVYGDRIPVYESIVERWVSDEYVVQWLKYKTYRKLGSYWDMDFASDHSAFDSVYKYNRVSLEGLDSVKYILKSAKTIDDSKNVLLFTLYSYNSMLLPEVPLDYIKKKYTEYCEDKDILEYLNEVFQSLPSCITSLNAHSLEVAIELGVIQKETLGKTTLLSKDKEHIEHVFHSLWKYFEIYNNRVVADYYENEGIDDEGSEGSSATFSIKKRYLLYAMKQFKKFPTSLASEFAGVDGEEFTEDEFYKAANRIWKRYNLHLKGAWSEAFIRGFYIPQFIRRKLEPFCNVNELLMNTVIDDLADRDMLISLVYYYMTDTNGWERFRDSRLQSVLNNNFRSYWYALNIDETEDISPYRSMLSKSIPERVVLFTSLEVHNDECHRYLMSNDKFSILSSKLENQFRVIANFKLFLESRLYGDLISISEVRNLLQEYPEYILDAFNEIIANGMTMFSRESIYTILDCSLDYYLQYVKEKGYVTGSDMLKLKNEHLKSLTKDKARVSNTKAADIFFGKGK